MQVTDKPILVTGARGAVGRIVLDELRARHMPIRASSRRPQQSDFPDGVEVVAADLTDPGSLDTAFDGTDVVFLYAVHEGVRGVVEAARHAGVQRVVLMSSGSVLLPSSADNPIAIAHAHVEAAFASAPQLELVAIRPLVLAANALNWSRQIKASGSVTLYQPDALTAPIHERDIAEVAVAVLAGGAQGDVSGVITGPDRISQRDQVAEIGRALGHEIAVLEETRPEATARLGRFVDAAEVGAVLMFLDDAAAGNSPATSTVQQVLARPALSFESWVADHVDDFR